MSARLHFIVEGQTEETFVNRVLVPHLASSSVWASARCVATSRKRGAARRGGLPSYALAKNDILPWMKEESGNRDAAFTTMFDLYALPTDFPGYAEARKLSDPFARVEALERALREDFEHRRLLPYIQLHEYEALLLAAPRQLETEYLEHKAAIDRLVKMASEFASPELIDDGDETAPSKRIIKEIPEYEGMKASVGPLVAEKIGLPALRGACRHFGEWLARLEALG